MSTLDASVNAARPLAGPQDSATTLLAPEQNLESAQDSAQTGADGKPSGKRQRLFGLIRKKSDDKTVKKSEEAVTSQKAASGVTSAPSMGTGSPLRSPPMDIRTGSPLRGSQASGFSDASPSRRIRSSSPKPPSPSSSSIFERNVQDPIPPTQLSPAIPAHIQTENYIPPVLEASSEIITNEKLNPDEVEIVMHAAHQPAGPAVSGSAPSESGLMSPIEDLSNTHHESFDDSQSTYGTLDPNDTRRLSFISFADVVQAEHAEGSRDSVHLMSMSSTTNRSPSPVRSPMSSHGMGPSPPTSGAPSMKGVDIASAKLARLPASPTSGTHSPPLSGELQIETMRQALRKTGSGDLSGVRSQPMSATSLEDSEFPFK